MEYRIIICLMLALVPIYARGDSSTDASRALGCMFENSLHLPCLLDNEINVPTNLEKTFKKLPQAVQKILQNGDLRGLTENQFASLPNVFFTLLPVKRLSELNVSKLVRVIALNPGDTSLAVHMVSAVKTSSQKTVFMEKIKSINATTAVQHVLASAISDIMSSLEQNESRFSEVTSTPFLLHMPPSYLLKLNDSDSYQIVYHLKMLAHDVKHRDLNLLEKRIWASLCFKHLSSEKQYDWLLTGLNEEELTNISMNPTKFLKDFSIIQARAVFEKVYENQILVLLNFNEAATLLPKLTPSMLKKFPVAVQDNFNELPSPSSVATAKQISQTVITNCIDRKKLTADKSRWGVRIKYLQKWVYMLPLSVLKQYTMTTLKPEVLNEIQSEMLTNMQAYYLTNKGNAMDLIAAYTVVLYKDNLLSALPTSQLLEDPISAGTVSSVVLEHILAHLPGNNIPRMVSLMTNIINSLDLDEILFNLLKNKAVNSYFDLMSSNSVRQTARHILSKLRKLQDAHLKANFQQLPTRTLSVLLREAKTENMLTWENLINSSQPLKMLVNGLNCDHIHNMQTSDFIMIISYYNQQREMFKKLFPKNLQYCCLQKLMKYLQLKVELHRVNSSKRITSVLEPVEIQAVTGYVLLGLPVDAIEENQHKRLILAAIGKLSVVELLVAADLAKLKQVALIAARHLVTLHFADYFELGNLVWFVPPNMLPENTTYNLKLAIETGMLDKRLCLNAKERESWAMNLIKIFGTPEFWSRGKLATLGDLLLVFSEDMLQRVNESSWIGAADTLQSKYYDTVEWTQPVPFYKICMAALNETEEGEGVDESYLFAVKRLVLWRLRAAERQLSTVGLLKTSDVNIEDNRFYMPASETGTNKLADMLAKEDNSLEEYEYDDYYSSEEYSDELNSKEESTTEFHSEGELITNIEENSTIRAKEVTTTEFEKSSTSKSEDIKTETEFEKKLLTVTDENSTLRTKEVTTSEFEKSSTSKSEEDITTKTKYEKELLIVTEENSTIRTTEVATSTVIAEENTTVKTEKSSTSKFEENVIIKPEENSQTKDEGSSTNKPENTSTSKSEEDNITKDEENSPTKDEDSSTTKDKDSSTTKVEESSTIKTEEDSTNKSEENSLTTNKYSLAGETESHLFTTKANRIPKTENHSTTTTTDLALETEGNSATTQELKTTTETNPTIKEFITRKTEDPTQRTLTTKANSLFKNETISITNDNSNDTITTKPIPLTKYTQNNSAIQSLPENIQNTYTTTEKHLLLNNSTNNTLSSKYNSENISTEFADYVVSTTTNTYDKDTSTEEEQMHEIQVPSWSIFSDRNVKKFRKTRSVVLDWSSVKFSCDAIKMVGKIAALSLTSKDIENMEHSDLNECREVLGSLDLPKDVLKTISDLLDEKEPIHLTGSLLQVAFTDILHIKMKLSEPWILETISAFSEHITDSYLISSIVEKFISQNNIRDISVEALAAMRGFICHLDIENTTNMWHRFHHVVVLMGRLPGCPPCLPKLAEIAVSPNGFGEIDTWQVEDVETLGNIVAGLNDTQWQKLLQSPKSLVSGLQSSAVHCLSNEKLKVIPKDLFPLIPSLTLAALNKEHLSNEQNYALQEVKDLKVDMVIKSRKHILIAGHSSSTTHTISLALIFVIIFVYNLV